MAQLTQKQLDTAQQYLYDTIRPKMEAEEQKLITVYESKFASAFEEWQAMEEQVNSFIKRRDKIAEQIQATAKKIPEISVNKAYYYDEDEQKTPWAIALTQAGKEKLKSNALKLKVDKFMQRLVLGAATITELEKFVKELEK